MIERKDVGSDTGTRWGVIPRKKSKGNGRDTNRVPFPLYDIENRGQPLEGVVDGHVHTADSDGSHKRDNIIQAFFRLGGHTLGIVNHDTIRAADRLLQDYIEIEDRDLGKLLDRTYFGAEVRTIWNGHEVDLLLVGYNPLDESQPMEEFRLGLAQRVTEAKKEARAPLIPKINDLGREKYGDKFIGITDVDVERFNPKYWSVHTLARTLMKRNRRVVTSLDQAITELIKPVGVPDVKRPQMGWMANLAHEAGMLVGLPHLGRLGLEDDEIVRICRDYDIDFGECYYPDHSTERTDAYVNLMKRINVMVSVGSDHHGRGTRKGIGVNYRDEAIRADNPNIQPFLETIKGMTLGHYILHPN